MESSLIQKLNDARLGKTITLTPEELKEALARTIADDNDWACALDIFPHHADGSATASMPRYALPTTPWASKSHFAKLLRENRRVRVFNVNLPPEGELRDVIHATDIRIEMLPVGAPAGASPITVRLHGAAVQILHRSDKTSYGLYVLTPEGYCEKTVYRFDAPAVEVPEPYVCEEENAPRFLDWIRTRGGLALWRSVNLSDPGRSWTAPLNDATGAPKGRPHPYADAEPHRIITNPDEVLVMACTEVKRFHVAVRLGRQGLSLKLTDASTRKVRAAVAKAGEWAYHLLDHETQEAIIMAPTGVPLTLTAWAATHNL